jgi:hypothetical protein
MASLGKKLCCCFHKAAFGGNANGQMRRHATTAFTRSV